MTQTYRIVLHGGAGPTPGRDYRSVEAHLAALVQQCAGDLAAGSSAIDVVEHAVRALEDSGLYVAGRGTCPNSAGAHELDASIMDGDRHRAGGVAAARDLVNPIAAARLVMEQTPHVLLAGDGVIDFARQHALKLVTDPATYYRRPVGIEPGDIVAGGRAHGTVGAVALDQRGRLAAATSTGGVFGKPAGRVGDSPLPGHGCWADARVAISCTGVGEAFILAGGAYDVAARLHYSASDLDVAAQALLARVAELGGDGGLIAVDRHGRVAMPFNASGMKRAAAGNGVATTVAIF